MAKGKVYILTNDAMPGIIKIGITEGTIEDRMKGLDNTSVPLPFRFYFAIESERYVQIENHVHNAFTDYRLRNNREFFKVEPEKVVAALRISGESEIKMADEMIDAEGRVINNEIQVFKKYKKRYSFTEVNIPIGSELIFTRDENKKCKIISDNEVEFQGNKYSLSKLALLFLNELGYHWKTVNGTEFFEYNGKTLKEIKNEIEENLNDEEDEN